METNNDAVQCRMSASSLGYFKDDYINIFTKPTKKQPLINRGTYTRTVSIDNLLRKLVQTENYSQIVSLGSGFDTRYFRLELGVEYFEVDFSQIVESKKKKLASGEFKDLTLVSCDLREDSLISCLEQFSFDKTKPTVFLAECVLAYMSADTGNHLLSQLSTIPNSHLIYFDIIQLNDRFGQQMIKNLKSRGLELDTMYSDLGSTLNRFKNCGWTIQFHRFMNEMFNEIDEEERLRISRIEIFDEFEEWELVSKHYILINAKNF